MSFPTPKIPPVILREYDIRGIVGQDLTPEIAQLIGRGFGSHLVRLGGRRICVGYDGRLSSPALESALCRGLIEAGIEVLRVGLGPSPLVYFTHKAFQEHHPTDGAIMVTGSHNGPDYNGFKMMAFGASFFGAEIQKLGQLIESGDFVPLAYGSLENKVVLPDYVAALKHTYDHESAGTHRPLRIAIDPGHGAMCDAVRLLIPHLAPHYIVTINDTVDGTFPAHHPDPTVESNLDQLKELVIGEKCDVGIAFDGDGDRIGIVDDEGHVIWGDQLLLLYAIDILKNDPGRTVVVDIKASDTVTAGIVAAGGRAVFSPSGHSIIKTCMKAENAVLAGEMSGHMFFADRHLGYDDALYAAVRLIGQMMRSGLVLSAWRKSLPTAFNTPEIRLPLGDVPKKDVVNGVKTCLLQNAIPFLDIDGVRAQFDEGWFLVRASNTAEELVMRVEARTESDLAFLKKTLLTYIAPFGLSF